MAGGINDTTQKSIIITDEKTAFTFSIMSKQYKNCEFLSLTTDEIYKSSLTIPKLIIPENVSYLIIHGIMVEELDLSLCTKLKKVSLTSIHSLSTINGIESLYNADDITITDCACNSKYDVKALIDNTKGKVNIDIFDFAMWLSNNNRLSNKLIKNLPKDWEDRISICEGYYGNVYPITIKEYMEEVEPVLRKTIANTMSQNMPFELAILMANMRCAAIAQLFVAEVDNDVNMYRYVIDALRYSGTAESMSAYFKLILNRVGIYCELLGVTAKDNNVKSGKRFHLMASVHTNAGWFHFDPVNECLYTEEECKQNGHKLFPLSFMTKDHMLKCLHGLNLMKYTWFDDETLIEIRKQMLAEQMDSMLHYNRGMYGADQDGNPGLLLLDDNHVQINAFIPSDISQINDANNAFEICKSMLDNLHHCFEDFVNDEKYEDSFYLMNIFINIKAILWGDENHIKQRMVEWDKPVQKSA